jgi:hypothetical protein
MFRSRTRTGPFWCVRPAPGGSEIASGVHAFTFRSTSCTSSAATGAQFIASDLLGRSVRLNRPVIELAGRGQCEVLSPVIRRKPFKTRPPRGGLGDIVDWWISVLHLLENISTRRRLDFVQFRAANRLRVDELFVVRPELRKDGEGLDVRALGRKRGRSMAAQKGHCGQVRPSGSSMPSSCGQPMIRS